jgi:hypothetical protein
MSPKFFETIMGRRFLEGTVPSILDKVDRLNDNLEKIILLAEKFIESEENNTNE